MALDLYVGTLTRYYLGDWENIGQQWAREHGMPYQVVRPGDEEQSSTDTVVNPVSLREAIYDWREVLTEGLGDQLEEPLEWNEALDTPYYTDRPHWDGYGALVLLAALEENAHHSPPDIIDEQWTEHPAYLESKADNFENTEYLQILMPELWLPADFPFTFRFMDLTGHTLAIGSATRLLEQLRLLNDRTFKGDEQERELWCLEAPKSGGSFQHAARFGLGMFLELAEKAVENRLPLKLDY